MMRPLVLGLILLTISSMASAKIDLTGTWVVSKRTCYDGTAPKDHFSVNHDLEMWTFDAAKSEFSYELRYNGGSLVVHGTYRPSEYVDDDSLDFTPASVVANPKAWNDAWVTGPTIPPPSIEMNVISPTEIQFFSMEQVPFEYSCSTGNLLIETFDRY